MFISISYLNPFNYKNFTKTIIYPAGFIFVMKKLLLLIFLLCTAVSADEFYTDKQYVKLNLDVDAGLNIKKTSSNYQIDYIRVNMFFVPKDNYMQNLNSISVYPQADISDGSIFYEWESPGLEDLEFGYSADVTVMNKVVRIKSKVPYPITADLGSVQDYTLPSEIIDSDDEDIIALASELAAGEDDLFVITSKLASWTKHNIEYNLSTLTASVSESASWTLENRYGVCDELTSLFIAMCRSLGIPSRFIAGVSYTNSELFSRNWGAHGWAEVYFPGYGWIPFDPTYGQYGFIDPSHVLLRASNDPAEVTTKYEWKSRNIEIRPTGRLEVNADAYETGKKVAPSLSLEADVYKQSVGYGSYQLVELEIRNLKDYYVASDIYLSVPAEIEVIDDPLETQVLEPLESRKLFWILKVPENLRSDLIYTFPVSFRTSRNDTFRTSFKSGKEYAVVPLEDVNNIMSQAVEEDDKNYSLDVSFDCSASDFYAGVQGNITCVIENRGNVPLEDVNICLNSQCYSEFIGLNQKLSRTFSFTSGNPGLFQKTVTAKNSRFSKVKTVDYEVLDKPSISITNISAPRQVEYNDNYTFVFSLIKDSRSNPLDVNIVLDVEGVEKQWNIEEMQVNQDFFIDMTSKNLNLGLNRISVDIEYNDERGNIYTESREFNIELVSSSFWQKILIKMTTFAKNITIWLDNLAK